MASPPFSVARRITGSPPAAGTGTLFLENMENRPDPFRDPLLIEQAVLLDFRFTAMQPCSMAIAVPISKRGTFTIPPEIRKRLGVDRVENPMLLIEEQDGKLYLEPAAAIPVRDIPKSTLERWIQKDEADMATFSKMRKTQA